MLAQVATAWLLLASGVQQVRADANGNVAATLALTTADGSVRTQAGVRLALSPVAGAPDRVHAMSGAVQARMGALRACFAAAMGRSSSVEGRADFELETTARGTTVRLVRADVKEPELVSCMQSALAGSSLRMLPAGSRAQVSLTLSNPLAALRRRLAESAPKVDVHMLAGGRAESDGGTQAGEVKFQVKGSAYAVRTIAGLSGDLSAQLAALLDCRRKAARRGHGASGSVELALTVRGGELAQGKPRSTLKRGAPQCVAAFVNRLDASRLEDADLELAVSFSP